MLLIKPSTRLSPPRSHLVKQRRKVFYGVNALYLHSLVVDVGLDPFYQYCEARIICQCCPSGIAKPPTGKEYVRRMHHQPCTDDIDAGRAERAPTAQFAGKT